MCVITLVALLLALHRERNFPCIHFPQALLRSRHCLAVIEVCDLLAETFSGKRGNAAAELSLAALDHLLQEMPLNFTVGC
jgi:hypothetical protein